MTHFVVIGGFPRAGTTFLRALLNHDENVCIRAEIYGHTLGKTLALVREADERHAGRWTEKGYRAYRTLTILNTLHGFGKRAGPPATALLPVEGFKTPSIETRARELIELLGPSVENPLSFVYCVRNITSNYLSAASVWGTTVTDYVGQLKRSAAGLSVLRETPHVRVVPFSLDSYLAQHDQAAFLRATVLDPLEVRGIDDESLRSFVRAPSGTNSTEGKSLARRTELTAEESDALFGDAELHTLYDDLESFFGVSLVSTP